MVRKLYLNKAVTKKKKRKKSFLTKNGSFRSNWLASLNSVTCPSGLRFVWSQEVMSLGELPQSVWCTEPTDWQVLGKA